MSATELQNLRWGRIWRGVEAAVREANPRQSPWLSGRFGRRVFGFGPDDDTDPGYAVVQVPAGYRVDAGSLAGVTVDAEIGVYGADPPVFPPLDSGEDLAARKGTIRVVRAERASSEAVAVTPFVLPEAPRGRLVRSGRDACLRVALAPNDAHLAAQLATSPLIRARGARTGRADAYAPRRRRLGASGRRPRHRPDRGRAGAGSDPRRSAGQGAGGGRALPRLFSAAADGARLPRPAQPAAAVAPRLRRRSPRRR